MPKRAVQKLLAKYHTRDPFEIAKMRNINIRFDDLGTSVRGYYMAVRRQKFILINNRLDALERRVVCAHELGHDILHPGTNTPFLRNYTYQCTQKSENEANTFAAHLLISDDDLAEARENGYTIPQLAAMCEVPQELVKLRIKK